MSMRPRTWSSTYRPEPNPTRTCPTTKSEVGRLSASLAPFGIGSTGRAQSVVWQVKSAKQLSVRGYDDGGQAHRDRPHTHGEIESPVDEKAGSNRNSDKVIGRRT